MIDILSKAFETWKGVSAWLKNLAISSFCIDVGVLPELISVGVLGSTPASLYGCTTVNVLCPVLKEVRDFG